jgi:hypothetical protein
MTSTTEAAKTFHWIQKKCVCRGATAFSAMYFRDVRMEARKEEADSVPASSV